MIMIKGVTTALRKEQSQVQAVFHPKDIFWHRCCQPLKISPAKKNLQKCEYQVLQQKTVR